MNRSSLATYLCQTNELWLYRFDETTDIAKNINHNDYKSWWKYWIQFSFTMVMIDASYERSADNSWLTV